MHANEAQKIGLLANSLNAAPSEHRWAIADSSLLLAIENGETVRRGPRGYRLWQLLRWSKRFRLNSLVLFATGLVELSKLLVCQGSEGEKAQFPTRVFVGFFAGSEEMLYSRYLGENTVPVAQLNQLDVSTFGRWYRLGLPAAFRAFMAAYRTAMDAISGLPDFLLDRRLEFMTFAAMRLGVYSYMRAWFENLRSCHQSIQEVCFLSADTPAFAAVDAGLPTRYLQHGLIRNSLILPEFKDVDALTVDEMRHFQNRLPQAKVRLNAYPNIGSNGLGNGILIASIYEKRSELELVLPFLEWAREHHIQITVRRHPCEDSLFWSGLAKQHAIRIEDSDSSFEGALKRLRPRLVLSWYSTALADALQCGIIPVTVNDESSQTVKDMVYPLFDRTLQWPRHRDEIVQLLEDNELYRQIIQRLQAI